MLVIDGYCHCGISRYLPVEDVSAAMGSAEVDGAVLCQHMGEFDNSYLAGIVRNDRVRFAAVALLDWEDESWRQSLDEVVANKELAGLRIPHGALEGNPEFCHAAASSGLILLVDAAPGVGACLAGLSRLLRHPKRGPVVLPHLGYPQFDAVGHLTDHALLALAREPDLYVLISGQSMFCEYPYSVLDELTRAVIGAFGPERLMWGSNFPEGGGTESYCRDLALVRNQSWGLSSGDLDQILFHTPASLWFPR